ncbi:alpha/beta fold hydrolase [Shimazuella kribbensis]|uniref:alpha/beta fold hydrolase n=1 Tax=Shimazuella kribbensis TaxID=139808 RepID=UPI00042205C2|nr:alpha/beta hydrolase [Shimazuella kribbensis]
MTKNKITPIRKYFQSNGINLSYLDFGGNSENILLVLHGHMNDARTFLDLAARLKNWRVIGLDQRGHGWSDHSPTKDYSRESYIEDIHQLIRTELDGQAVTILGHSLGGINAYQFAARYPAYVKAVIVEDIGVEIELDMSFVENFPERSTSLEELRESLIGMGVRAVDYFSESVFQDEKGWGFRSDVKGIKSSQENVNGVWWDDWLASHCPMLLIYGRRSFVLDMDQAEQMASRRPNTKLEVFENAGHGVHSDDPEGYFKVVQRFLEELK